MREVKKGVRSEAANYVTKGKAMRRLHLKAKQFHRLCILKGIFPREPKKKTSSKTYYHLKDVRFLEHEKLLEKFREIDAWMKKVRKAKMRGDDVKAKNMAEMKPDYTLHHLVKERYPAFGDALADLDDALTLVCLFASCPSHKDLNISHEMVQESDRLWREFQLYLVSARAIRKVFLSVKGIYYQADIKGQVVTWLVPYQFSQSLPLDVDYSIMMTFLEFYHTLLRFVNYKLYADIEAAYPPDLAQPINTFLSQTKIPETTMDLVGSEFLKGTEMEALGKVREDVLKVRGLFDGLVFLLGRETPRYSLELVIRACGGEIVAQDCERVTHQVVDRPLENLTGTREYLQPQWVYDSLNFRIRLPLAPYRPGLQPPPHLSPFVDSREEEYVPERLTEILQLKGEPLPAVAAPEPEQAALGKLVMPKKLRKLYQTMQYGLRKKKALIDRLHKRLSSQGNS
jgi:pescadillo protein